MTDFAKLVLDADTRGLKSGEKDLQSFAGVSKDVADRAVANMKAIGMGLTMKVTLPLVAAAGASLKMASDFQTGMSNVSTLVDTATESMDAMGKKVLEISQRTPVAISDLTDALYNVRSAGIDAADAMGVLEGSARLGVAGLGTTAEAVDLVTSSINAFGLEGKEQERVYDVLFRTVKSGKTTLSELTQGFGATATSMANAGVKLDDYMASIAALTTTGLPASEAQTQLKAAIAGLTRETENSRAVFGELGVETFPELIKKTGGLVPAFAAIKDQLGGNDGALIKLVGSVEAYNAIIGLTGTNNDAYTETLAGMRSGLSEVDKAFEKQNETMGAQAQRTTNAMQSMGISIGTILAPAAEKLAIALAALAGVFMSLPDGAQTVTVVLGGLAAAVGPVLWLFASFVAKAPLIAAGFTAIKTASLALLGNPLLLGAAAVILGVYLAWKNWDKIAPILDSTAKAFDKSATDTRKALDDMDSSFDQSAKNARSWLDSLDASFDQSAVDARNWVKGVAGGMASLAASGAQAMQRLYTGVKTWLSDKLGAVFDSLKAKVKAAGDWFYGLWDRVVGHSYIPDMVDAIGAHMGRLDALLVGKAKTATEKAAEHFQALNDVLGRLFPEAAKLQQFDADMETLKNSSLSVDQLSEAISRLRREYAGLPDKPFWETEKVDLSSGLITGDSTPRTADQQAALAQATAGVGELVKTWEDGKGKITGMNVTVSKSFKDMADATIGAFQSMVNAIKGRSFLDILGSVIGMLTQLGSIGAFGKGIQTNLNKIPGNANGTRNWGGGLSVVGERGPELVSMPRGSQVFTNSESRDMLSGGGGGKLQIEVVANNNGFGAIVRNHAGQVVAEAAPALMQGGAQVAQSQAAYRQTRRVA